MYAINKFFHLELQNPRLLSRVSFNVFVEIINASSDQPKLRERAYWYPATNVCACLYKTDRSERRGIIGLSLFNTDKTEWEVEQYMPVSVTDEEYERAKDGSFQSKLKLDTFRTERDRQLVFQEEVTAAAPSDVGYMSHGVECAEIVRVYCCKDVALAALLQKVK